MVKYKYIDWICIGAAVLAILLTLLLMFGEQLGLPKASANPGYVTRLFDDSRVHVIDIQIADWSVFIEDAEQEEYVACTVEIDGEAFHNIGLRAKGNNSLRLTEEYGLSRYSLKLEFDQFLEEAFARRNFGNDHGKLYKPDYRSLNAENADVALRYIDDNPDSYPGIFENAKFKVSEADQKRMIEALKTLSTGEKLETAVNVDEVLRYFTVQVFVMNWDSYLGHTVHNYFLYEENGILSILPWDYNLAFGTYALGMTDPVKDPNILINYPINTPAEGEVMLNRPLYHNLMKHDEYFARYHAYFDKLLSEYFESGRFAVTLRQTAKQIAPYVQKDPTAFCSYEDHQLAVDTLEEVCLLRAESIRGQLDGEIPATIRGQQENPDAKVDASVVKLTDLGDFEDLESAKERQDAALRDITGKST